METCTGGGKWRKTRRRPKLAVAGAPPCNMSNDSNGGEGLESLWNLNGEFTTLHSLFLFKLVLVGREHVQSVKE